MRRAYSTWARSARRGCGPTRSDSSPDRLDPALRLRQGLAVALALGILVPSFIFIRQRLDLHHLNAAPLNQALDVARRSAQNANLLFVNLPAWVSTPQFWYPIGHEGALFMPKYSSMADFISTNLNQPSQARRCRVQQSLDAGTVLLTACMVSRWAGRSWRSACERPTSVLHVYGPDKIELVEAGR